jgi:hypothetical protein
MIVVEAKDLYTVGILFEEEFNIKENSDIHLFANAFFS